MNLGQTFLISIFILIVGLLFETIFIISDWKKELKKAALFKGLAAFCFVLLGGFFLSKNPSAAGWCIFPGLILGMTGDICLAVKKNLSGLPSAIINVSGILSFMAGHFFYIMGLFYSGVLNFTLGCVLWILIYIPVNAFLLSKSKSSPVSSRLMGCIYLISVTSTFCTATALFSTQKNLFSGLFTAGAFLFLVSDIITMYNSLLTEKPRVLRAVNLAVYYAAQLLIALSIFYF